MGALVSSSASNEVYSDVTRKRAHDRISMKYNEKNRISQSGGQHRTTPQRCRRRKRSSVHRPVLQLQLKPETLERVRRRTSSNETHSVMKQSQPPRRASVARETEIYENWEPKMRLRTGAISVRSLYDFHHTRQYSTGTTLPDSTHYTQQHSTGSRDSMVLLNLVEDANHLVVENNDEDDYDHLTPKRDFSHLCACTYGPIEDHEKEACPGDGSGSLSKAIIMQYNRNGSSSVMVTSGLTSDQLKERIRLHQTPPELCRSSSVRRSKSTTAISNNREINALEQAKLSVSTTNLVEESSDWTLGESIIRALSAKDLMVFDIENPTRTSELQVIEAWPNLKDKLQKWRSKSYQSINGWV